MQAPKKNIPVKDTLRAKAGLAVEATTGAPVQKDAVEGGRKPLPARRTDLAALRAKIAELYAIPSGANAAVPSIEASFQFAAAESDADYYYLHVEPLLEHAATLLGRCAAHRSRRDALHKEKWALQLELDRFLRVDQVEERERAAGADTVEYERAILDAAAEQSIEEGRKHSGEQWKDLTTDLAGSGWNRRMAAREQAAWVSAYPLKDGELRGDDANYTFDGARKSKPDHLFEAARQEADQDAWEQFYSLLAARYAANGESEAGRLRKESLNLLAKWALASIAFRRDKAQAERDMRWEQIREVQAPGSLLHYHEQIAPLERGFAADFREALACLAAARRGLKELYDYAPPFPAEGAAGYFDDVASWAAAAQNAVGRASGSDQEYVLTVSVKQLAASQWEAGRAASQWTFDVPEELFAGQAHVRLRGVGVSLVGPAPPEPPANAKASQTKPEGGKESPKAEGFWTARLSVPAAGAMRTAAGTHRELDQKSMPPCVLGRVADRDSAREPEVAGVGLLHNASPIGKQWRLILSPKSTDGMETARLQDVQVSLHVAVRHLRAAG